MIPNTDPRGQDLIRTEVKVILENLDKWQSTVTDVSAQVGQFDFLAVFENVFQIHLSINSQCLMYEHALTEPVTVLYACVYVQFD